MDTRNAVSLLDETGAPFSLSSLEMVQVHVDGKLVSIDTRMPLTVVSHHRERARSANLPKHTQELDLDGSMLDDARADHDEDTVKTGGADDGDDGACTASTTSRSRSHKSQRRKRGSRSSLQLKRRSSASAGTLPSSRSSRAAPDPYQRAPPALKIVKYTPLHHPAKRESLAPLHPDAPYVKYAAPSQADYNTILEYDLDEEDSAWLRIANAKGTFKRRVSESQLEQVMDALEKSSFVTMPTDEIGADDAICCVCLNGEVENTNNIVLCDVCNIAVHQLCYGVPFIPEGRWLCRKCQLAPASSVSCALCPNPGGAFKQCKADSSGVTQWAHVACATWIPETDFENLSLLEPVHGLSDIPQDRYSLRCYICGKKGKGACIQCATKTCCYAFHVTCAQYVGLTMKLEERQAFCHAHTPQGCPRPLISSHKRPLNVQQLAQTLHGVSVYHPPVAQVPADKLEVIKQQRIVPAAALNAIVEYWSLKRSSRHGAPLLRRLQVTFGDSAELTREEQQVGAIRKDLEKLRLLLGQILRRERLKFAMVQLKKRQFEAAACPLQKHLMEMLGELSRRDREALFAEPVDTSQYPDYLDIVETPMDLSLMQQRVAHFHYVDLASFVRDVLLMCHNALRYNERQYIWFTYIRKYLVSCQAYLEQAVQSILLAPGTLIAGCTCTDQRRSTIRCDACNAAGLELVFEFNGQSESESEQALLQRMVRSRTVDSTRRATAFRSLADKLFQQRRRLLYPYSYLVPDELADGDGDGEQAVEKARAELPFQFWELVWAKTPSFPPYPAVVVDPDFDDENYIDFVAPDAVLAAKPTPKLPGDILFLIRFFDTTHSWNWVTLPQLSPLGTEQAIDKKNLTRPKKGKRRDIQKAFDAAQEFAQLRRKLKPKPNKKK
eukprot:m.55630 g.55630  ORF g.55630 m.55630 type:complete len:894 (+) comp11502_c0_seq3:88-2769(+)